MATISVLGTRTRSAKAASSLSAAICRARRSPKGSRAASLDMSDTRSDTVSVAERTRPVAAGGAVVGAHYLGRTAAFVLAEEAIVLAGPDGEPRRVAAHGGAILAAAS